MYIKFILFYFNNAFLEIIYITIEPAQSFKKGIAEQTKNYRAQKAQIPA